MCVQVMVASGQKNLTAERMKVCKLLWDAGIKVHFTNNTALLQNHRSVY